MDKCPKCSTPFEPGTQFCSNCGCSLTQNTDSLPTCPICHREYPAGTTFCSHDGAKLVISHKNIYICSICGTEYPAGTRFCSKDGGAVVLYHPEFHFGKNKQGSIPHPYVKAPIGERFLAAILDGVFCVLLAIPAMLALCIGLASTDNIYFVRNCIIMGLLLYLIPIIYAFIKDGLGEGQSWGKRVCGIKVVYISDGTNCTKGSSALRTLIGNLLVMIPVVGWLIEPMLVLVSSDRRRVADMAAGTAVVKVITQARTNQQGKDANFESHYMK